jgi:hypothetical protein
VRTRHHQLYRDYLPAKRVTRLNAKATASAKFRTSFSPHAISPKQVFVIWNKQHRKHSRRSPSNPPDA